MTKSEQIGAGLQVIGRLLRRGVIKPPVPKSFAAYVCSCSRIALYQEEQSTLKKVKKRISYEKSSHSGLSNKGR